MPTCNRLDLQTLGSQLVIMPRNFPDHWCPGPMLLKVSTYTQFLSSVAMIREKQQLVTDEAVEFEKYLVEV